MAKLLAHRHLIWLAAAYVAVIALILYPAFHERLGFKLALWDCIPPTLGLIFLATAFEKTTRHFVTSAIFTGFSTLVMVFFALAWFFTPLDTDPHSTTTALVFVFAPLWSVGIAIVAAGITWFVTRPTTT
jgi:hypothetical protein